MTRSLAASVYPAGGEGRIAREGEKADLDRVRTAVVIDAVDPPEHVDGAAVQRGKALALLEGQERSRSRRRIRQYLDRLVDAHEPRVEAGVEREAQFIVPRRDERVGRAGVEARVERGHARAEEQGVEPRQGLAQQSGDEEGAGRQSQKRSRSGKAPAEGESSQGGDGEPRGGQS